MQSKNNFQDIFKNDIEALPSFDFWNLLINAPKYTSSFLKWCTYPFVFLLVIFSILNLFDAVYSSIAYEDMGFSPKKMMIAMVGIGIALWLWIGIARDRQVKDAIRDFHIKFAAENKSHLFDLGWTFEMSCPRSIYHAIENLSRGSKLVTSLQYCFRFLNSTPSVIIGDMIRSEMPTSNRKHGYKQVCSFVFFNNLKKIIDKKTVFTDSNEINEWFKTNLNIDLSPFDAYKFTLRLFSNQALLEFEDVIGGPQMKLKIGQYFEPKISNEKESVIVNTAMEKEESLNNRKQNHFLNKYPPVAEYYKEDFTSLTYDFGNLRLRFRAYSYASDPMEVENSTYLEVILEKKSKDEYVRPSINLNEVVCWSPMAWSFIHPNHWKEESEFYANLLFTDFDTSNLETDYLENYLKEKLQRVNKNTHSRKVELFKSENEEDVSQAFQWAKQENYKLWELILLTAEEDYSGIMRRWLLNGEGSKYRIIRFANLEIKLTFQQISLPEESIAEYELITTFKNGNKSVVKMIKGDHVYNLFVSHFDGDKCDQEAIRAMMNWYHDFILSLELTRTRDLQSFLIDCIK